jgi:hypothetical protein
MHDLLTGRSMSGIIHFLNQTPIQWFAKKQATVETATYGSEFMVARQATEQILDIRYTLRMMGIPIDGPSWLFGDNQSVITSSTIPTSTLNKRHNALSYHRVRECIAMAIIYFLHIEGKNNPSDVLTKFLGYAKLRPLIQPLLFWKGETILPETPIPVVIRELQDTKPSGLRGVINNNNNPSDFVETSLPSSSYTNPSDFMEASLPSSSYTTPVISNQQENSYTNNMKYHAAPEIYFNESNLPNPGRKPTSSTSNIQNSQSSDIIK